MIPADYQPPKIEIVHEITVEMPKKESLRLYPVKFFEYEKFRAVTISVEDKKQNVWVYDVTIYFNNSDDFVADLKVPRQLFSYFPTFHWHQEYLESLVEILLQTKWGELVESYNEEQAAILELLIEASRKRDLA